ncbi:MAG: hypothetical protein QM635_03325 [Microbacteriaceae bacterium]
MNVLGFLVSLVLFLLGFFLMGEAFAVGSGQAAVFFAGILVTCLGVALPVHLFKRIAP